MNVSRPSTTTLEMAELHRRYTAALDALASWGVRIRGSSRVARYRDQLSESVQLGTAGGIALLQGEWVTLGREVDEIIRIVESFKLTPPDGAIERLRLLASDKDDPWAGSETPARDAQYELALYAELSAAHLKLSFGSPDLLVETESGPIAIEAKRPKVISRVTDRVRKAAEQLGRTEHPGVIAISLDLALFDRNELLIGQSDTEIQLQIRDRYLSWLQRDAESLMRSVRGKNVVGFLFTCAAYAIEDRALTWSSIASLETLPSASLGARARLESLKNAYRSGRTTLPVSDTTTLS